MPPKLYSHFPYDSSLITQRDPQYPTDNDGTSSTRESQAVKWTHHLDLTPLIINRARHDGAVLAAPAFERRWRGGPSRHVTACVARRQTESAPEEARDRFSQSVASGGTTFNYRLSPWYGRGNWQGYAAFCYWSVSDVRFNVG